MTFGSLFAGIGGLDLGLERAGFTCRWQVEINPFSRAVLSKHWPDVPQYEDVRTVGAHVLERVDLICGGFPCQDISNAGKRHGITGARSGLWAHFARLVGELRPRYVLIENVGALAVRGLDRVLADLAALGCDAEWTDLRAADVGAPHRRERIFILAYGAAGARRVADAESAEWRADHRSRSGAQSWPVAGRTETPGVPRERHRTLADADREGPGQRRAPHDDDGQFAFGHDADGCGPLVADRDVSRQRESGEIVSRGEGDAGRHAAQSCGARHGSPRLADAQLEGLERRVGCILATTRPGRSDADALRPAPGGWPAGPGEPQYAWEPPRTLAPQSALGGDADGISAGLVRHRRQQLEAYGNAVVPALAQWLGERILNADT